MCSASCPPESPEDRRLRQAEAQLALGQMLMDQGDGDAALEAFRSAALSGDGRGWNMMGRLFEAKGEMRLAARHYFRAAEEGDTWGMFNLADLHLRGEGAEADPEAAYALYTEAAQRGHVKSLNMLGRLHEEGHLGPVDLAAATAFYRAGAEKGDCWAGFNLGRLALEAGDTAFAVHAFAQALEDGHPAFHLMLARELANHPVHELTTLGEAAARKLQA